MTGVPLPGSETVKVKIHCVSVCRQVQRHATCLCTLTEIKYKVVVSNSASCTAAR